MGADGDFGGHFGAGGEAFEEDLGGEGSHFMERLADGGEAWGIEDGLRDVVETDDRDFVGNVNLGVVESADDADGRHVVEADDGGETAVVGQEGLNGGVAELR